MVYKKIDIFYLSIGIRFCPVFTLINNHEKNSYNVFSILLSLAKKKKKMYEKILMVLNFNIKNSMNFNYKTISNYSWFYFLRTTYDESYCIHFTKILT